jgi:cellulose synthase/poly-beta-1,6-N-acetylglucosamine synthase-like glycosyltransferase
MTGALFALLALVSVLLSVQAAYTLYMMIYTWDQPEAERLARAPDVLAEPELSFTVMLPARHEEEVIQQTIRQVVRANYPSDLLQVLVICSSDDEGTVDEALQKIEEFQDEGLDIVDVVLFDDKPINKPHGLNHALRFAKGDVVTIFDAEDDMHPDVFNIVNTVMVDEGVRVVQAGVQLMDYQSSWYSTLNVLEYFFWFKSRLHYHAKYGSIPLGGNTVFFNRELLLDLGGWDEDNLTEDADIGLRISERGEPVRVIYDDRYVTREETPPTLQHFIKQRTRWSQGFMQTLQKGTWRNMPTRPQRWLAFYTLAFPNAQALLGIYVPLSLLMTFTVKAPVVVALISYLPVLLLAAHFMINVVGLYEFAEAHGVPASPVMVVKMAVAWFPYQWLLAYAALRAMNRQLRGQSNWEKTAHVGLHRDTAPEEALVGVT